MDAFTQRMRRLAASARQRAAASARQLNARSRALARQSAAADARGNAMERQMMGLQRAYAAELDEVARMQSKLVALVRDVRIKTGEIRALQGRLRGAQQGLQRRATAIKRLGVAVRGMKAAEARALGGSQLARSLAASRAANAAHAASQLR